MTQTPLSPFFPTARLARQTATTSWMAALLALGACASPPTGGDTAPAIASRNTPAVAAGRSLSEADRNFILEAASAGLYVVEVSKLAESRTENPLIKAYAAMLVRDHAAAVDYLRQLAGARGLNLPEVAAPEQRSLLDAMKALPPEEFNQRYVQQVGITGHQAGIRLTEAMVAKATDPELKGWATRMLVLLREHLAAAQRLPATTQARAAPAAFEPSA